MAEEVGWARKSAVSRAVVEETYQKRGRREKEATEGRGNGK